MAESNRRIAYALFLPGYPNGIDRDTLRLLARKVPIEEYEEEMSGSIYCPGCFTLIDRTPKKDELLSNGRTAFYRHLPKYKDVACYLRAKKPKGKRYDSEEEAKRAIQNKELSIIKGFLKERPENKPDPAPQPYDETPVEDINGELSNVPIGRHKGQSFELPSIISTVAGICRNFEENLNKYFFLPDSQHAIKLAELLINVDEIDESILDTSQTPRLYFGLITNPLTGGSDSLYSTKMTRLKCHPSVKDFSLKDSAHTCHEKGITKESKGRIILFYGKITSNGLGLGVSGLSWGEYALLPKKYNDLLIPSLF